MIRYTTACVVAIAMILTVAPSKASAVTLNEALERMDEIISEMLTLRAEFEALSNAVSGAAPAGSGTVVGATNDCEDPLTGSLENGDTSDSIAKVQRLLATDPEIYPYGVDSGFFGPKTTDAVRNLQARFGLDTVGVIGPATTALLEAIMCAYPDENYPENALERRPQVAGAQTSTQTTVTIPATPTPVPSPAPEEDHGIASIFVEIDDEGAYVRVQYEDGGFERLEIDSDNRDEIIAGVADELDISESEAENLMNLSGRSSRSDGDEEEAEEALDDADDAIDDAEDRIEDAEDDGEDVDDAWELLEEAEEELEDAEDDYDDGDYEDAIEKAEEAEELAEDAIDAIGGRLSSDYDEDDIDEIEIEVEDGEAYVEIFFEDDSEDDLTIEEDDVDDILEELSDELGIDEDDLEDLIDWDFGDVDEIIVRIEDGEVSVRVEYESGVRLMFEIDEDDEDDMLEDIADEIDEDEDDIEPLTSFDYFD